MTWTKDDFEPYLKVVFDSFGSDRLMIGSDWPVCMLASDYGGTMQIIIDYIAHLNQKEKALILGETALNVYNIPFE
jgi:L-fuconolactonase